MANNVFQVKRTNTSGRTPNTTGSYATNSQYIAAGEFALNMADGILYSSNGTTVIEVGANTTNQRITNSLTINNARNLNFQTVNTSAAVYFTQQNDDNFVLYSTNTAYGARPVFGVFANSITSNLQIYIPLQLNSGIVANNSLGTAGQVLTTNSTGVYWSSVGGTGTVTSVATGNGMTGGPITTTGTVSILANNGITANSTGTFVTQGTGVVVNATGVHVNAAYINTIAANSATFVLANNGIISNSTGVFVNGNNGLITNSTGVHVLANSGIIANSTGTFVNGNTGVVVNSTGVFVNATYIGTISANNASFLGGVAAASYVNTSGAYTITGVHTYTANLVVNAAIIAGGNSGTAGQVLTSNGAGNVYWSTITSGGVNTAASYTWTNTQIFTANVTVNGAIIAGGNSGTAGQLLASNGTGNVYWTDAPVSNAVYMKGGAATIGTLAAGGSNIFRVNANTLNYNTTISTGENAQATGPISVGAGITLTVESGARVAIV